MGITRVLNAWASPALDEAVVAWLRDLLPAPAPDALTKGSPIQILRLGPIYGRLTGKLLGKIDDAMCAELARDFYAGKVSDPKLKIPIDWNHNSSPTVGPRTADQGMSFGEIIELVPRPGQGLWAVPAYTERGLRLVQDSGGVLYTSPEFTVGPTFSRGSGEQVANAQLMAVALTNRPQQDNLETVRLSEAVDCRDNHTAEDAISPDTADLAEELPMPDPTLADVMGAVTALGTTLGSRIDKLEAGSAAMAEKLAEKPAGPAAPAPKVPAVPPKLSDDPTADPAVAAMMEHLGRQDTELAAIKAERLKEKLDHAQLLGHISVGTRTFLERIGKLDPVLLTERLAAHAINPEIPLAKVSGNHPAVSTLDPATAKTEAQKADDAHAAKVAKYAEEHKLPIHKATVALLREDPNQFGGRGE